MLYKILPEQIADNWEFFAPVIADGLPPTAGKSYRGMVNVLEAILNDKLVCWGFYEGEDLIFLLTTQMWYDDISKTRKLLIYSFTGFAKINSRMFGEALEALKKYAKSNVCETIIAYVMNERLIEYLKRLGAKTDYTLIEMEVV